MFTEEQLTAVRQQVEQGNVSTSKVGTTVLGRKPTQAEYDKLWCVIDKLKRGAAQAIATQAIRQVEEHVTIDPERARRLHEWEVRQEAFHRLQEGEHIRVKRSDRVFHITEAPGTAPTVWAREVKRGIFLDHSRPFNIFDVIGVTDEEKA